MDNKEEIIEEINDVSEVNDIKPSINLRDDKSETSINEDANNNELAIEDINSYNTSNVTSEEIDLNIDNIPKENIKVRSKAPIIIILSVLLFLDLAALVIYLIGVDKVLQFLM